MNYLILSLVIGAFSMFLKPKKEVQDFIKKPTVNELNGIKKPIL